MHVVLINYGYSPGFPTAEALLERFHTLIGWAEGLVAAGARVTLFQRFSRDATIERGKYLAVAADCAACHTAPNHLPFAGGLPIDTPLGTIYSTNITPSAEFGIGRYTEEQFARALRRGIRGDRAHLYPAMPYTSYAKFTDEDTHALYLYFKLAVAPVDARGPTTELPFPMNIRLSMLGWNWLFLDGHVFTPDPKQSAQWNRGAYLVVGATHCSTCIAPMEPPMTQNRLSMPRWSIRHFCVRTMSRIVITGNDTAHGSPLAGFAIEW